MSPSENSLKYTDISESFSLIIISNIRYRSKYIEVSTSVLCCSSN